jgi:uncharacterized membrane protein
VLVLDVTDPLSPTLLADSVRTLGSVEDLDYDATTQQLYIAAGEGGFEIWDLQNPSAPDQLSLTELMYGGVEIPVMGVAVNGDWAYIAADWGWIHWVDISDPNNPVQVGYEASAVRPLALVVSGNDVYAVGHLGGGIIPGTVARFIIQPDGSLSAAEKINLDVCIAVYATANNVYVGRSSELYILTRSLSVVSVSSLYTPGVVVSGDTAYVASGSSGLHLLDVSDPVNPVEIGLFDSPGEAGGVLADGSAGLRIVDVMDPADPSELGFYETPGRPVELFVSENYAYMAEYNEGVLILDVSNPITPTLAGTYQYSTTGYANDVFVQDDYAYVADWTGGLRIVDVSDPANPVEVSVYADLPNVWQVFVAGDYAYVVEVVVNQPYWLHIIDISDPAVPTETGAIETADWIWEVFVEGDYAYIANYDAGLSIVDVSDPANPVEVGSYSAPDVLDVIARGDYAYVASSDWDGGFLVLDVSDPANPVLVGTYNPGGVFWPFHLALSGPYAYAGNPVGEEEVALLDISDPANPTELEIIYPTGELFDLSTVGPYLYIADGYAGFKIYENLLPIFDATLGPDSEEDTLPGSSIVHHFTLDNLGETDGYTLTVSGSAWPTTLLTASPITVPALSAVTVTVQVEVPHLPLRALHDTDSFTLTAASAGDPGLVLTTTGTTNAVTNPDVTLAPPVQTRDGSPGTTVTYGFTVTNAGDYSDTFALAIAGNAWDTSGPASVGPLGVGEEATVAITVTIPQEPGLGSLALDSAIVASDSYTLTASSGLDEQVTARATGTTNAVVNPDVTLAPPAQAADGSPGTVVTYGFTVTNAGDYSDTFALAIAGNAWDTSGPASVGPLGVGDAATVAITVTIPQEPGLGSLALDSAIVASDSYTLTASSGLDEQVSAYATATTNAVVNPVVSMSGDQAGSGMVGTQVTYVFTVTNVGDYRDSYTLTVEGFWPATLSVSNTGPLAPGASSTVSLTVHVPTDIADGDQAVTTLMAISGWDGDVTASTHATTTGYWWRYYLPVVFRR